MGCLGSLFKKVKDKGGIAFVRLDKVIKKNKKKHKKEKKREKFNDK